MIRSLIIGSGVALVALSCSRGVSRIQTAPAPQSNPTSYSFPLPIEVVHAEAVQVFSIDHQIRAPIFGRFPAARHLESILSEECSTNAVCSQALFRDPANTNDIYLHSFHTPFTLSPVYRGRAGGLPYMAAFHLHLSSDGVNTLASVTARGAEVVNGEEFGFGSCGPGYGWNFVAVKPTSVEEYMILRYLGRNLGVTNMPEVILPIQ